MYLSNNVCFLDFGCGTLSSSIGFAEAVNSCIKNDIFFNNFREESQDIEMYSEFSGSGANFFNTFSIDYLLIDISAEIIKINKLLTQYKSQTKYHLNDGSCYEPEITFWNYTYYQSYNEYGSIITGINDDFYFIEAARKPDGLYLGYDGEEYYQSYSGYMYGKIYNLNLFQSKKIETIIVNFCYVFASNSIDVPTVLNLFRKLFQLFQNIIIVHQNPDLDELNTKWQEFKEKLVLESIAKGVAPIKHYSNSKVRYEVLFKSQFSI